MAKAIQFLIKLILAALVLLFAFSCSTKVKDEPAPSSILYDGAALLSSSEQDDILSLLTSHNNKGPGKIHVLTMAELPENTSIENYASDYVGAYINLDGGKQNGILLIADINERKLRIHTSKDVWELLKDEECVNIIDEIIAPEFKKEQFFVGIQNGLKAMIKELEK